MTRRRMGTRIRSVRSNACRRVAAMRTERGDVPGWVLVAVMTAGLVTGLWVVADEQLSALLARAISSVGG